MLSSEAANAGAGEMGSAPIRRDLQEVYERARAVITAEECVSELSDEQLQCVLAVACKEFALRQEGQRSFAPFAPEHSKTLLTATDAAVLASAVLDALSVEIFELGLWKTWGTT